MQEAEVQTITVQDIQKRLKCSDDNQAFSLCANQKCQKPKGIMCVVKGCKCRQLHPICSFVHLQGILETLLKHRRDITQEIQKSYKISRQTLTAMIQQLSQVINRLERQQKYFGLRECEISFMELIQEYKFEKICGKFINELVKKTFQSKQQLFMQSNKHIAQKFQAKKAEFGSLCEYIQNNIMKLTPQSSNKKITPDEQSQGLIQNHWVIDNTNSNVCIANKDHPNWLCSSALPFDGEFVFTIKILKLTEKIQIGVMEEQKKGDNIGDTYNYSVYLAPDYQRIYRPNEEQTEWRQIVCQCSSQLPQCPFQIECHVNQQQNTIAWHYAGKQQAKTTMPLAWKTNKKSLCAVVWVKKKGDCVEMM